MLRSIVLGLVLLTLAAPWGANAGGSAARLDIVGYAPDNAQAARLAIQAAGGTIVRSSPELGFSVASTNDAAAFERAMKLNPVIQYVENDDPTSMMGGQWNGAQWNGAQWNGAQWNGAQWNGGQWNGAQWNGAGSSDAQRQAYAWTTSAYPQHNTEFQYDLATSDPGLVWQWGEWVTDAAAIAPTTTGAGAKLCVLDSGVADDHPDLAPNMWTGTTGEHGINLIDPTRSPYDDAGHGTHIAGVAAARVGNAFGVAGVANAAIMSVKVLNANGEGLEDQLAIGLAWCATHGARVAVMALGVTQPGPSLDRALQFAADRDVLLLASAGNAGPCAQCVGYPASDPRVLAVSAVDGAGALANFSSKGPEVDLAAPGVHVLGPFLEARFVFGSGTSQAVGVAAGVAALVRGADPALTASEVAAILKQSATDLGPAGSDPSTGHGMVDAEAALTLALA